MSCTVWPPFHFEMQPEGLFSLSNKVSLSKEHITKTPWASQCEILLNKISQHNYASFL